MVKEPPNLFPGLSVGEKVDIFIVPGFKITGVVIAVYDDAIVLENSDGNYEIAFKGAITMITSYNETPEDKTPTEPLLEREGNGN